MAILFSAQTNGFYDTRLHDAPPADAVEISDATHAQLLAAQETGDEIIADGNGAPIAQPPAPDRATLEDVIKKEAARRIDDIAPVWRQINDLRNPTPEGAARFTQIDAIRSASAQVEADLTATPDAGLEGFDVSESLRWQEAY